MFTFDEDKHRVQACPAVPAKAPPCPHRGAAHSFYLIQAHQVTCSSLGRHVEVSRDATRLVEIFYFLFFNVQVLCP